MINRIPLKVFQICSIILFFLVLFQVGINKFILNTSEYLNMVNGLLFLVLNPIVILGYYKLAIENSIPSLKKASLTLAITTFIVFTIRNTLFSKYAISEIIKSPLLYLPYFILGAAIVYFAISLFIINYINNRDTTLIVVISIVTGVIYLSYVYINYVFFANWFFYGALARYLFPKKEKSKFKKLY